MQASPLSPLSGLKLFDLTGRVAVITGGSKGLGQAMAAGLASAGADVRLVRRHGSPAEQAAAEIARDFGRRAVAFEADVTVPVRVEAMIAAAQHEFGRVDILINSAGINIRGPIETLSLEQFQPVMSVNVTGTWLCSRAVLPLMQQAGHGRISNPGQRHRVDRPGGSNTLLHEQRRGRAVDAHTRP